MCSQTNNKIQIENYINELETKLDGVVSHIGWDKSYFTQESSSYKICPFDSSHRINSDNYDVHVHICSKKHKGIYLNKDEKLLPPPCEGSYFKSIKFDRDLQATVILDAFGQNPEMVLGCLFDQFNKREVPDSHTDAIVDFTRDERLAMYKYVVKNTGHFEEPEMNIPVKNEENNSKQQMTFDKILALNRRLQKRKIKYRVKKEPPLSYIEEIRRLIGVQMEAYEAFIGTGNMSQSRDGHIGPFKAKSRMGGTEIKQEVTEDYKHHSSKKKKRSNSPKRGERKKHKKERSRSKSRHRHRTCSDDISASSAKEFRTDPKSKSKKHKHRSK